jgi:hypothetical protein
MMMTAEELQREALEVMRIGRNVSAVIQGEDVARVVSALVSILVLGLVQTRKRMHGREPANGLLCEWMRDVGGDILLLANCPITEIDVRHEMMTETVAPDGTRPKVS